MSENTINTPQYIDETLAGLHAMPEARKMKLNLIYSAKALIFGRKWLVYIALTMIPIAASLLSTDRYLNSDSATAAYVENYMETIMLFLLAFGALLITLPHTADEISDHVMDIYVVKPSRRSTIFLSRVTVSITGLWLVNSLIAIVYYSYFHIAGGDFSISNYFDDIHILGNTIYLVFFAALMYGSIFTFVGVIGNRGFTFGVLLAMLETFFISLLFLNNSPAIPRTHLQFLANDLFGNYYNYGGAPDTMELWHNYIYFGAFTIASTIIGLIYFRRKQFQG